MGRPFSVAVLAGGESRRFGADKTLARLDGQSLTAHVVGRAGQYADDVFIVTKHPEKFGTEAPAPVVKDHLSAQSPLVGITTALEAAREELVFVIAADMPLFDFGLARDLASRIGDADIAVPVIDGRPEPLACMYAVSCRESLFDAFKRGASRIIEAWGGLVVVRVEEDVFLEHEPDLRSFTNINTPGEMERVAALFGTAGAQ